MNIEEVEVEVEAIFGMGERSRVPRRQAPRRTSSNALSHFRILNQLFRRTGVEEESVCELILW